MGLVAFAGAFQSGGGTCADAHPDCEEWAQKGFCDFAEDSSRRRSGRRMEEPQAPPYFFQYWCPRSCGECGPSSLDVATGVLKTGVLGEGETATLLREAVEENL